MNISDLINDLDKNLSVTETKKIGKTIYITCKMDTKECKCPYCNEVATCIHSNYIRTLSDLPIQNNEVKLLLVTRKFFCSNPNCDHKTFGERFAFVEPKAVRTNRLNERINKIGLRDNSMDAVRNLKDEGIRVSSNTVLRIVKKNSDSCNLRSQEYRHR